MKKALAVNKSRKDCWLDIENSINEYYGYDDRETIKAMHLE